MRLNLNKKKTKFTPARSVTSASKSLQRNQRHQEPLPEEAAEAYTMLIGTSEQGQVAGDAARQGRRAKKESRGVARLTPKAFERPRRAASTALSTSRLMC